MRAVVVTRFGGPEVLSLVEVPSDPLRPGQVRIRVRAAAVSPTDTNYRAGNYVSFYSDEPRPWIPGMDAAGEVVEVGEGVEHVRAGDVVMAVVTPHGAYREDLVLAGDSVVRAPARADAVAASTLPMNGLTAWRAMSLMALEPGEVLAVTGAAGAFGGYVVQLGKAAGLTIVADASESDEDLVHELGADIVVRRGDDVADRIRAHFPDGVHGLADGALQGELVLPAIRDGGVMTTVRAYRGNGQRGLRVLPANAVDVVEGRRAALEDLSRRADEGEVTLRVARTFAAQDAAEAHRRLEKGGVRGRLVLTFTD